MTGRAGAVSEAGAARYVELEAVSNYSFLRGASHPEELVRRAADLGFDALGIADRNSLAGAVRVHAAARTAGLRPLVGVRLDLADAPSVLAYPCDRAAYGRLCRLLTEAKDRVRGTQGEDADAGEGPTGISPRFPVADADPPTPAGRIPSRGFDAGPAVHSASFDPGGPPPQRLEAPAAGAGEKRGRGKVAAILQGAGEGREEGRGPKQDENGSGAASRPLRADDLLARAEGMALIVLPPDRPAPDLVPALASWRAAFPGQVWLALRRLLTSPPNDAHEAWLADAARTAGAPLVATNAVLMHHSERRPVADVLACLRTGRRIDEMGLDLLKNAERRLKSPGEMARLFRDRPEAIEATSDVAGRIGFSLDQLRLDYPDETGSDGRPAQERLERAVREGAKKRYRGRVPARVQDQLDRELTIVRRLGYAAYFLTVYDLVRFAKSCGILAQGRGSAANSAVCYVLGITAVDPAQSDLLFERFVSEERGEPPDIDVDFEHERREEVIQHVYERWGRRRAALTATVIHFRTRLALREAGKALGLSEEVTSVLAANARGGVPEDGEVRALGLDPQAPRLRRALAAARALVGFPRHLSQHPGGFVIAQGRLDEIVPIVPAAMPGRTVIEWDKDDLEALGILKVDVLGLGMLTCLRKGFDLLAAHHGRRIDLAGVPQDDPGVYEMLGRADSLGVFQVESRAQMSFLPRMKPRDFYDLVIEVAIVRPGPIQGGMVHPYLRRRNGVEPVRYPLPELEPVLGKTLGVPIFQEQAMRIAIVGAGFTPEEADKLRRAMATFRRVGTLPQFRTRFIGRLVARGCPQEFAEQCWRQIEGFGEYGFPESHSASFAVLVYASAWLKHRYPEVFACALLNSQPMGFYAPAQIVRDARTHGVEVRPADVNASAWDCTLEPGAAAGGFALRLGFRLVKGFGEEAARRLAAARGNGYREPEDVARRAGLGERAMAALAGAAAFGSLDLGRREGWWAVERIGGPPLPLFAAAGEPDRGPEPFVALPAATVGEEAAADYRSVGLSLRAHPVALLREAVGAGVTWSGALARVRPGARAAVAGVVLVRQRPRTAKGVIFLTLEDMEGPINVVVWERVFRRFRFEVLGARLMRVEGRVESSESVVNVIADRIVDLSDRLEDLADGAVGMETETSTAEGEGAARGGAEAGGDHPYGKAAGGGFGGRREPCSAEIAPVSERPPVPGRGHPRNEARRLFPSRDFH